MNYQMYNYCYTAGNGTYSDCTSNSGDEKTHSYDLFKRMCKVKLKWTFGKVKLKFAENQILIWRQRFLSTFGRIVDPSKGVAIIRKSQNDKADERKTEFGEGTHFQRIFFLNVIHREVNNLESVNNSFSF